jgi:hypothetical protein
MIYALTMAWLLYCYARSKGFRVFANVTLGVSLTLSVLILTKHGFLGPFFEVVLSIPVNFIAGVYGVVTQLLG